MLVAEYEQANPSFTALVEPMPALPAQAKRLCRATPSVGFLFNQMRSSPTEVAQMLSHLPPRCQVIGGDSQYPFTGADKRIVQGNTYAQDAILNLLSLPEACAQTFTVQNSDLEAVTVAPCEREGRRWLREDILGLSPSIEYKVMVVLPGQRADNVELLLKALQEGSPSAAIVGGIFARNLFCWKDGALRRPGGEGGNAEDGIVGMALWGNVPLQAVVSRGVVPCSPSFTVSSWEYEGEAVVVKSLSRPASGDARLDSAPDVVVNPLVAFEHAQRNGDIYVGLQIEDSAVPVNGGVDGGVAGHDSGVPGSAFKSRPPPYELLSFVFAVDEGAPVLLLSFVNKLQGGPPPNARLTVKFFDLKTQSAQAHVQKKMRAVAEELRRNGQDVLGALLFSCNGRGPRRFLDARSTHVDASAFTAEFPGRQVGGMYAMGEIGPQATYVDEEEEDDEIAGTDAGMVVKNGKGLGAGGSQILRNSQSGSCALQGFTAVFALLVAPRRSSQSSHLLDILNKDGLSAAIRLVLGPGAK